MTNKEIRDNATPLIPFNGSFFVDQDFINMYEANDTEEACEMALDIIQDLTRADERERMLEEINEILAFFNNYSDADKKLIKAIHNKLNTREKQ